MRIMIVEDNDVLRRLYVELFQEAFPRSSIFECGTVEEGIMQISSNYDALVTDFNTPRGNALELIEAARIQGVEKIILITGQESSRAYQEIATQAAEAGATACFRKPCTVELLINALSSDSEVTV